MGSFNCSLRFRSNFKFAIQWQFLKWVCLLCITSACHYNERVKSHIHNNYRLLDVFICCFPLSQPLLILILLNHRHTCKDAYLQSFFPMGLSVFFLKNIVCLMQEKSICFSTDTPLVCVTHSAAVPRLKAIGELWSTLSYSVIFSFVTLCFILIPLVPSWYFLLKQPKTDKVLYDFTQTGVWFHWFTYWLRESRILTRYIFFYYAPFPYALCWVSQGVGGCICWDSRSVY